jgi:hypothetical protein
VDLKAAQAKQDAQAATIDGEPAVRVRDASWLA